MLTVPVLALVFLTLAMPAPFFGQQAVRLLRESWGGAITPDAQGTLQEKGAKQLAEELYAMFDDAIPQTQNGPVTINKLDPGGGLTINNPIGGNSIDVNGGDSTFGGDTFTTKTDLTNVGGGTVNIGGAVTNVTGDTLKFTGGSVTITGDTVTIIGDEVKIIRGGGGGDGGGGVATTVFLGRVVSGSGDTYQVDLYGNGSGKAATATVSATVPQIDPGETIPAGTWVGAVHQFTTVDPDGTVTATAYEFQIPVWL